MFCHEAPGEMSWNVMFCHVPGRCAASARPADASFVPVPHAVPPSRFVPLRSALPAARLPGAAGPCFARNARARARLCAGAVRAPDCAREPQGARLPCVSQRFFETGATGRAAPGKRLRMPPLRVIYRHWPSQVKAISRIISKKANIRPLPGSAGAQRSVSRTARLWTRTLSARIDGEGALTVNDMANDCAGAGAEPAASGRTG